MKQHYIDERTGISYTLQGDYYLPTSGKLNSYLAEINEQAEDMFLRLVNQMAEREGVNEQLKAENQMARVGRMNNIRSRAAEIVNNNLIYN